MSIPSKSLKKSAAEALVWGAVFTLGRDVIQFGTMLILVRLLSPEIYGQYALAHTILLFLSVISLKTIAPFALQARDPSAFDWDTHFSAGATLNVIVTVVSLLIAGALFFWDSDATRSIGGILFLMSLIFPIEIITTHHFVWLQAHHSWRRMRLLLLFGAVLGAAGSIALASMGAGVIALALGNLLFSMPLLVDYVIRRPYTLRYRPLSFRDYIDGRRFGLNRMASASLTSGSNLTEHWILSAMFGFATLGIYTRSVGLAQITSGRIGPVVMQSLYPVLTRAEAGSDRFRRFAGILYQGVLWTSAPAALFLALEASQLVTLLYGNKWLDVIPLMGAAAVLLALRGLHLTLNQILLANLQQKICLRIDIAASISMFGVIFTALAFGPFIFIWALAGHAALILIGTTYVAIQFCALDASKLIRNTSTCLGALLIATFVMFLVSLNFHPEGATVSIAGLVLRFMLFSFVYVVALRLLSPKGLFELLDALPLPSRLEAAIIFLMGGTR